MLQRNPGYLYDPKSAFLTPYDVGIFVRKNPRPRREVRVCDGARKFGAKF